MSLLPGSIAATDVVSISVLIDGEPMSTEISLMQMSIHKVFNKVASAKMVMLDGSIADREFAISNEDTFQPGKEIIVQLGYHGEVEIVFEGIIVKHSIKVRKTGSSYLIVEAKDKAVELTRARKSAYYINMTDSDVIEQLAASFVPDIESISFSHKQLVQFDTTSWDFICLRAEANGMLVLTDDGVLSVKTPATDGESVLTATLGDNIFEFEAEMDARRQIQEVTSHSWDYTQQALEESDPGEGSFTENGDLASEDLAAVLATEVSLSHSGHLTTEQLQNWADAYALRSKLSKAVGRVRVQGTAAVKPGAMITLDGVGDRFNGDVFVTGVLHIYDGDWKSDIQFGWKEEWFCSKEDITPRPASGLLAGVNGLQIGVVLDLDDTEDGGQYRVKVHVPTITSGNEGIWARVATLDAGPERGVYFRPQVNDEVLLGFLNDDPREPVILGCLHSKDTNKSPLPEQEGTDQYGIVTKEKLKLIFDDTNKTMSLIVPAGAGEKSIVINTTSGALELKDENQNSIKLAADGITIQAGAGNVTIKGVQVLIN